MEQRKHARYRVEYAGSFSGEGIRAQGVILDLSSAGCRARSAVGFNKGEVLGVLIDVPRYETPLHVSRAVVRWSHGQEFGMEFIQMEPADRRRLRQLIRQTEVGRARRTEHHDAVTVQHGSLKREPSHTLTGTIRKLIGLRFLVSEPGKFPVIKRKTKKLTAHDMEHFLSELIFLSLLIAPFAIVLALLIGLGSWIIGGFAVGLWASGITLCATIVLVPIYIRVSCGPDTRVDCDHCIMMASRLTDRGGQSVRKEQRRHPRYPVNFPATFSTDRICGFGMIADLSAGGCRVKSKTTVAPGDVGQLLITLPSGFTPLAVSQAFVRWVKGNECGLEFVRMDPEVQRWLDRITGQLGVSAGTPLLTK